MSIRLSSFGRSGYFEVDLPPAKDTIATATDDYNTLQSMLPGFVGNGDYFKINGNILYYYNNNYSLVWSVTETDIDSDIVVWGGMHLDRSNGLLYILGIDSDANPAVIYLATINSIGTIVNIGSVSLPTGSAIQAAKTFAGYAYYTQGACSIQLSDNNPGQLIFRYQISSSTACYESIIDMSDGSIISTTTIIGYNSDIGYPPALVYKTPNGIYVGSITIKSGTDTTVLTPDIKIYSAVTNSFRRIVTRGNCILVNSYGAIPVRWADHVCIIHSNNDVSIGGCNIYSKTDFDTFIETFARKLGVL